VRCSVGGSFPSRLFGGGFGSGLRFRDLHKVQLIRMFGECLQETFGFGGRARSDFNPSIFEPYFATGARFEPGLDDGP
jgi:hypothetical protein